jgi:2,3-dihydroxyphenylpropionate 1,2-dioxygenase
MMSTVIGGAMLPHAPQFFTMPDTEDKALVAHVREVAADDRRAARALEPDLWIIFSNDHAEQFFHTTAPPSPSMSAARPAASSPGAKFHWKVPSEIGFEMVRQLYRQNFDPAFTSTAKIDYAIGIPLTHLGHDRTRCCRSTSTPICRRSRPWSAAMRSARRWRARSPRWACDRDPVERRHVAFSRHRPLFQSGARLGRGGPGKARRRQPEIADRLRRGRARRHRQYRAALLGLRRRRARRAQARRRLDGPELAPQLRLARLDRRRSGRAHAAHYPSIKPELVELTSALHGLAHDPKQRAQYLADAGAFADRFQLPPEQREALIKLDMPSIVKMGAHPLVPFLAQLQMQRLRPQKASPGAPGPVVASTPARD